MHCMYYVKDGYKVIKDNNELGYILLLKQANITVFLPLSLWTSMWSKQLFETSKFQIIASKNWNSAKETWTDIYCRTRNSRVSQV